MCSAERRSRHTHPPTPPNTPPAPFAADSVLRLYEQIREEPVPFPATPDVSPALRLLLQGLLDKDPEKRLGLAQVSMEAAD
jgi:hypothetical protein